MEECEIGVSMVLEIRHTCYKDELSILEVLIKGIFGMFRLEFTERLAATGSHGPETPEKSKFR